jgi:hypothetical protein
VNAAAILTINLGLSYCCCTVRKSKEYDMRELARYAKVERV